VQETQEALEPLQKTRVVDHLRIPNLLVRFPERIVWALFTFVSGFCTIAILAFLAMVLKAPLIFPPLGATAILFLYSPSLPTASPRSAICGHGLAILCGYGALVATGLQHAQPATVTGVDGARIMATGLALATAAALMILFKVVHPPAGATALMISLGIIVKPYQLPILELAVVVLALQAIVVNRIAGVEYPIWSPRVPMSKEGAQLLADRLP
jgi:CBS domain-containing membrane protein